MKRCLILFLLALAIAAGGFSTVQGKQAAAPKGKAAAQAEPASAPGTSPRETTPDPPKEFQGPLIGPQADHLLRQMSEYLKGAKQFSFHAEITYDDLLPSGQKLQLAASEDVLVRRPDRIYAEFQSETGGKRFWYDGKTVTLYDSRHHVYATEPAPPTVDAMLEHAIKVLNFSPPLGDLLHSDPHSILTRNVQYGFYAGLTRVDGERCHHLAFHEKNIDWQIWIEDGTQLLPRKLVITYKTLPGAPQFMAVLSHWDLVTPAPETMFQADLPPGADRITFQTAPRGAKEGKGGTK